MTPEQEKRLFALFHGHSQDSLTEGEHMELQSLLRVDEEARRLWFLHQDIEIGLRSGLLEPHTVSTAEEKPRLRWFSWRPLAAAAAGLVIGAFSASAVWAFASAKSPRVNERELPLVDGSFEQTAQVRRSRPSLTNVWHGDPAEVVGKWGHVSPHSGDHMLRFLASSVRAEDSEVSSAADMWQIVELPKGGPRIARVRAWFAADTGRDTSFVVMAAAVACRLEEVPAVWDARFTGDSQVLSAANKNAVVRAGDVAWRECELVMQVPEGAEYLVIDVASMKLLGVPAVDAFPAQFVDDVSVTITDEPPLP